MFQHHKYPVCFLPVSCCSCHEAESLDIFARLPHSLWDSFMVHIMVLCLDNIMFTRDTCHLRLDLRLTSQQKVSSLTNASKSVHHVHLVNVMRKSYTLHSHLSLVLSLVQLVPIIMSLRTNARLQVVCYGNVLCHECLPVWMWLYYLQCLQYVMDLCAKGVTQTLLAVQGNGDGLFT